MSRSWLEKTFGKATIWLGRDCVSVVPKKHARDSEVNGTTVLVEKNAVNTEVPAWSASVEALQRLLEQHANQGLSRRLKIVVSNEFVRYVLAPWTTTTLKPAERVELVRALLSDRYGDRNDARDSAWHIVIEAQRFEEASLAAAIDIDLVKAIQALCARMQCRLISLIPALIENLNSHRHQLSKNKPGWYVNAGDGRLAVLAFSGGGWVNICNERTDVIAAVAETLMPILRRDAIRSPDFIDGTIFMPDACMPAESIAQYWPVARLTGSNLQTCA